MYYSSVVQGPSSPTMRNGKYLCPQKQDMSSNWVFFSKLGNRRGIPFYKMKKTLVGLLFCIDLHIV